MNIRPKVSSSYSRSPLVLSALSDVSKTRDVPQARSCFRTASRKSRPARTKQPTLCAWSRPVKRRYPMVALIRCVSWKPCVECKNTHPTVGSRPSRHINHRLLSGYAYLVDNDHSERNKVNTRPNLCPGRLSAQDNVGSQGVEEMCSRFACRVLHDDPYP
jgi:hypothetical protein